MSGLIIVCGFEEIGFSLDLFDEDSVVIRGIPALNIELNWPTLIKETLIEIKEQAVSSAWEEKFLSYVATRACHSSVRYNDSLKHEEIEALRDSGTMPTLLPGAAFFLGMDWPPARKMINAGLPIALATDFNPGSSPNGDMKLIMSLACLKLRMLPAEALNAATLNAAYAMGVEKELGSIDRGKKANIIITKEVPGMEFLPYAYGSQLVDTVILNGTITE